MKLIFIRHSISRPEPGKPADQWGLTEEGRALCSPLAEKLAAFDLRNIYSSTEPKAHQTALLAAEVLGVPVQTAPGLHEHERKHTPFLRTREEFISTVLRAFEQPDDLVLGEETINQCLSRFEAAIRAVIASHTEGDLAIASHGTVISLLVAKYNPVDLPAFWQGLQMPDLVVLTLPGFRLAAPV